MVYCVEESGMTRQMNAEQNGTTIDIALLSGLYNCSIICR